MKSAMPKKITAVATKKSDAATVPKRSPTQEAVEAKGWRRADVDHTMIQELGQRMRALREAKGFSLAELSELSSIPGATLSRIENSKMSPTFSVLARIMIALDVDWIDLVGPRKLASGERLMSFTDADEGNSTKVRGMECVVLHSQDSAHSLSLTIDVHARDLRDVGGLVGHRGEEFCYVLSGTLALHFEGREPKLMEAGSSALFDSATPHAYLAGAATGAKILVVVNRAYGSHMRSAGDQAEPT